MSVDSQFSEPESTDDPSVPEGPVLSPHERDVYHELARLDELAAEWHVGGVHTAKWYFAAVHTLAQKKNPDRFAQAAHSVREILEKLPAAVLDLPVKAADLGNKVRQLEPTWKAIREVPSDFNSKHATLSPKVRAYLVASEEFFTWVESDRDDMGARAARFRRKLDPTGRELPDPLRHREQRRWIQLRHYFNRRSKHAQGLDTEEFEKRLRDFGELLLEIVSPSTCDEATTIDEIIAEGENGVSDALVKKALEALKRPATYDYFFRKQNSPD